jgi:beta-carotene 3-hydroxylase
MTPYISIGLGTFLFMEFMAWFTHKYVMHGWLWQLHEDHHKPHDNTLEVNDLFALIFAIPSIWLIYEGTTHQNAYILSIGIGILIYGIAYFLVHDVYIHRRVRWLDRFDNTYLRAVRLAHKMHHKHLERTPGEAYGFLWVPPAYWKMAKRRKGKKRT